MIEIKTAIDYSRLMQLERRRIDSALKRTASYILTTAKRMVRSTRKPSNPGEPPRQHDPIFKRAMKWRYDSHVQEAVIGPLRLGGKITSSENKTVPQVLEFGSGIKTERNKYWYTSDAPNISSIAGIADYLRTLGYAPRRVSTAPITAGGLSSVARYSPVKGKFVHVLSAPHANPDKGAKIVVEVFGFPFFRARQQKPRPLWLPALERSLNFYRQQFNKGF